MPARARLRAKTKATWLAAFILAAMALFIAHHSFSMLDPIGTRPLVAPPQASTHNPDSAAALGNLFELPKADKAFVGTWGGYLAVGALRDVRVARNVLPATYYFGERQGVVYLKTAVYGDPAWPIVKKSVKVLTPRKVEFQLDSLCSSCSPQAREVEVTTLDLTGHGTIDAHVYGYSYHTGDGHAQATYSGTLKPLNLAQAGTIERQVERNNTLLTHIDSKRFIE